MVGVRHCAPTGFPDVYTFPDLSIHPIPSNGIRNDVPPDPVKGRWVAHDVFEIVALPDLLSGRVALRIDAFRDFRLVGAKDRRQGSRHGVSKAAGSVGGDRSVDKTQDPVNVIGHHDECVQVDVRLATRNLTPARLRDASGRAQLDTSPHDLPERGDAGGRANGDEVRAGAIVVFGEANRSSTTHPEREHPSRSHRSDGHARSCRRGNRTNSGRTVFPRDGQTRFGNGRT